jgi:hypothetical protein
MRHEAKDRVQREGGTMKRSMKVFGLALCAGYLMAGCSSESPFAPSINEDDGTDIEATEPLRSNPGFGVTVGGEDPVSHYPTGISVNGLRSNPGFGATVGGGDPVSHYPTGISVNGLQSQPGFGRSVNGGDPISQYPTGVAIL